MSKQTPTHLRKKSVKELKVINFKEKNGGLVYKTQTYYFCGRAKNMTLSANAIGQVTCKKCLDAVMDPL